MRAHSQIQQHKPYPTKAIIHSKRPEIKPPTHGLAPVIAPATSRYKPVPSWASAPPLVWAPPWASASPFVWAPPWASASPLVWAPPWAVLGRARAQATSLMPQGSLHAPRST